MKELEGQMALFSLDGCDQETQDAHADETCTKPCCTDYETEVCKYCGYCCTSSKECVELAGDE
jgi:hypothetical protein